MGKGLNRVVKNLVYTDGWGDYFLEISDELVRD